MMIPAAALIARNRLLLVLAQEARRHTQELCARAEAHRSRGGEILDWALAIQQREAAAVHAPAAARPTVTPLRLPLLREEKRRVGRVPKPAQSGQRDAHTDLVGEPGPGSNSHRFTCSQCLDGATVSRPPPSR